MKKYIFFLLMSAILLLPACSTAEASTDVSLQLGNEVDVEGQVLAGTGGDIDGDPYLFVLTVADSRQLTLHSFEIDDDGTATEVGSLPAPEGVVPAGEFQGTRTMAMDEEWGDETLYIPVAGEEQSGLWVVDISDPDELGEAHFVPMNYPVNTVSTAETLAAVTTSELADPVFFFDISDPEDLQRSNFYLRENVSTPAIDISGWLLAIVDHKGVDLVDISGPNPPEEITFYQFPEWEGPAVVPTEEQGSDSASTEAAVPPDVEVDDDLVYLANGLSGLQILRAGDEEHAERIAALETDGRTVELALTDNIAYVLLQSGEGESAAYSLRAIDITDPEQPKLITELADLPINAPVDAMIAVDDALYILSPGGVQVVTITNE